MTFIKSIFLTALLFPCVTYSQIQFIENKGQWQKPVNYKAELHAGAFFIEPAGFTIVKHNETEFEKLNGHYTEHSSALQLNEKKVLHSHAVKVSFAGAALQAAIMPGKVFPSYNNYFFGNDKSKWQTGCKLYEEIVYKNVYPGIDIRYYSNYGTVKYDFIIHPGGNIKDIAVQYSGAGSIAVKNNELYIATSAGVIKESFPYTYQLKNGIQQQISCNYILSGNSVSFAINNYDKQRDLIIDPQIIFSSFSGSTADNWGNCATPGPDGSLFSAGVVYATGYPASPGAFDQTFNGGIDEATPGYDIGLFKFSANGSSRLYATYFGGSGNEQIHSMMCDAQGNVAVFGRTNSPSAAGTGTVFPVTRTMIGSGGGYDIFISKFNSSGTALIGSVRMGGTADDGINIRDKYSSLGVPGQNDGAYDTRRNYGDDSRGDILIDNTGNIYIASCTQSSTFPLIGSSIIQSNFGGGGTYIKQDGIIAKFNSDLSVTYFSTFFGGSGNDACISLAINEASGNLYVSGSTTSNNLPGNTTNTIGPAFRGGTTDGFISIIKKDGSAVIRTTYEGTTGTDMIYGLQLDKAGYVYIAGTTTGNKTVVNAAFSQTGGKQFISKINGDLSGYVFSTNFGTNSTSPNISITGFGIDKCENMYVAGWGGVLSTSRQYPNAGTSGLSTTSGTYQSSTDGNDFYLFALAKNAASQLYGSFFGQNGGFTDHADGSNSRFDQDGILYQTICANCGATAGVVYPTTPGVWSASNGSISCNQAALKFDMHLVNSVTAAFKMTQATIEKDTICTASSVVLTATAAARKYQWNFGDGTPLLTNYSPVNSTTHTFNFPGTYPISLVSYDSLSCNLTDTLYKNIFVKNCGDTAFCNNTTIVITAASSGTSYQWQLMRPNAPYFETSYANLFNNTNFTGTTTRALTLLNAPTSWYGYKLRCVVDGIEPANIAVLKFVTYWTGAVNNAWENAGNWSCGKVPDANTDVTINSGTPVISSYAYVRSLKVATGASVNVSPFYNLTVTY